MSRFTNHTDGIPGPQGPQGEPGYGPLTRWSPNFKATGLAFTGTGTNHPTYNSYYAKNGHIVSFWIQIDLDTVTNFGTGQYVTELPFMPITNSMNHFSGWALIDPTQNPDLTGHIILNADHLVNTKDLDLHYLKQNGGAKTAVTEAMFAQNEPVVLTTNTTIYINGTYLTSE